MSSTSVPAWPRRLPFYYGWVVVAVAFVTMGIGVNARTSFSLLYPAILDEFGWDRGVTAGIFAFGFVASMLVTPFIGMAIERFGPRVVIPVGAVAVACGFALTPAVTSIEGLYVTLGALVVGGSVAVSYIGHSAFLPNWFAARRGLMTALAFSGVGVGGFVLFPLVQDWIAAFGWREACYGLALLLVVIVVPLNAVAQRLRPEALGLEVDGGNRMPADATGRPPPSPVVDPAWAAIDWTYRRILREPRFWALSLAFFFSLFNHYAVQVHQTKFFIELGYGVERSAWALGMTVLLGIPGQLMMGWLSDRIGREWGWAIAMSGYFVCFILFLLMLETPTTWLLYASIATVGLVGMGTAPLFGTIGAELFGGPGFGRVFGLLGVACSVGAATGAWGLGQIHDAADSYAPGFVLGMVFTVCSALCVAYAGPGRVRPVAGRQPRR
ncbi:MAG: MFS transporter [Pseudomonadota bacterium]